MFIVMSGKILIMALMLKAPYPGNATPLLNNSSVLSSNYIREGRINAHCSDRGLPRE